MENLKLNPDQLAMLNALPEPQRPAFLKLVQDASRAPSPKAGLKVSVKGAVSLYGINGRFPITLYANQWLDIFDNRQTLIREFIENNKAALKFSKPGEASA